MLYASAWSRSEGNSKECTNGWQKANRINEAKVH